MASPSSSRKGLLERISPGSPQDLLLRACTVYRIMQGPLRKDFTKTRDLLIRICERSRKDLLQDASRIFTRSSQKEGYKIMQEPLTVFYRDLHNIFSQGPLQEPGQDLHILRTSKTAPCNSCKIVTKGPSKELIRCLYQYAHGHLRRSRSCENLHWKCPRPRLWEPGGADFVRACAIKIHMDFSQKQFYAKTYTRDQSAQCGHTGWGIYRKMPHPKTGTAPLPTFCASLRSRNAYGHLARAIVCDNLQEKGVRALSVDTLAGEFTGKIPRPKTETTPLITHICASLRGRNALALLTRAI